MTKPRKMKRKEVALLVLPCVALAIMGWHLRDKSGAPLETPTNRFALVVDEVKVEPATPLQVSQGYDTSVTVITSPRDIPALPPNGRHSRVSLGGPLNTRLTYKKNGVEHPVKTVPDAVGNVPNGGEQTVFPLRLSHVPTNLGELTLKTTFTRHYYYAIRRREWTLCKASASVAVVVRKTGEAVRMPSVLRLCRLRIKEVKIKKIAPTAWADTRVSITMESLDNTNISGLDGKFKLLNPRLVDEHGKEVRAVKKSPLMMGFGVPIHEFFVNGTDENTCAREFEFSSKLIPANIPKVILKAKASVNDCWPLPISIVVREDSKAVVNIAAKQ